MINKKVIRVMSNTALAAAVASASLVPTIVADAATTQTVSDIVVQQNGQLYKVSIDNYNFAKATGQFSAAKTPIKYIMVGGSTYDLTEYNFFVGTEGSASKALDKLATDGEKVSITATPGEIENGSVVTPEAPVGDLKVESVSAITANSVEVTFSGNPKDLTAQDFSVNGGLNVVDVQATTGNKAKVTFSTDMTDGANYVLQLLDREDNVVSSASFKYDLGAVASISLTKSKYEVGENVEDFLKVFDDKGVEISTADYNVTDVETSNSAVVDGSGDVLALGTTNLRFEITYKDGSTAKSDFIRVDVEEAVTAELAGYVLGGTTVPYDNTEDYRINGASGKTDLYESDVTKYLYVYADDSKGNPEIEALDLSKAGDYTVESKSPAIISVEQNATGANLTPISKGTATIVITGKDNYKKTLTVSVKEDPEYKDLLVGATSLKLSDEAKNGNEFGVNQEKVKLQWVDQYGLKHDFQTATPTTTADKITKTDAIKTGDKLVISIAQSNDAFELRNFNGSSEVAVRAVKDKTVSGATIRVSYYANASDNKPTTQKTISTSVVDVDANAPAFDYETILSSPAIDAHSAVDSATVTGFALDKNGNRLTDVSNDITLTYAESVKAPEKVWFSLNTTPATVAFKPIAEKQMTENGTLKLEYTVAGSSDAHGTVNVAYDNSFMAPDKAVVANNSVLINTKVGGDFTSGITAEELLFGKILADSNQLVIDTDTNQPHANNPSIAVKKGFTGYANKPVLNFLDKKGKMVVSGASLYGLAVDADNTGNGYWVDLSDGSYDADTVFNVEYSITNAKNVNQATGTDTTANTLDDVFTIKTGENQATFTVVVTKVTVANDLRVNDNNVSEAKNLLVAPKAVNVVLSNK